MKSAYVAQGPKTDLSPQLGTNSCSRQCIIPFIFSLLSLSFLPFHTPPIARLLKPSTASLLPFVLYRHPSLSPLLQPPSKILWSLVFKSHFLQLLTSPAQVCAHVPPLGGYWWTAAPTITLQRLHPRISSALDWTILALNLLYLVLLSIGHSCSLFQYQQLNKSKIFLNCVGLLLCFAGEICFSHISNLQLWLLCQSVLLVCLSG